MSIARLIESDEHELYPIHEDDTLPERPVHERTVRYLRDALDLRFPQYWVSGEVCMYWIENAFNMYRAPDVLVLGCRPAEHPFDVYLSWKDPPALLVVEVGSKSTFKEDEGPKIERYLVDLDVREYLYFRPHPRPKRRSLRMWRLEDEEEVQVSPEANGRLKSLELDLEFGLTEEGDLRVYDAAGLPLPVGRDLQVMLEDERKRADRAQAVATRDREKLREERDRVSALEQELARFRAELERRDEPGAGG